MNWLQKNYVTVALVIAATIALVLIVLFFGVYPIRELNQNKSFLAVKDYLTLRNGIYSGLAQAIGGAVLLIGLFFTWKNIRATEKNLGLTQENMLKTHASTAETLRISGEGQITERFTRAIEQIGNQEIIVRLGGIYSLERIASDSEKDHRVVMEFLSTFVREKAAWSEASKAGLDPKPASDIQAILTVIGRRNSDYAKDQVLDLSRCDLRSAKFGVANLKGINFEGSHFEDAQFFGAHLEGAVLRNAFFKRANFTYAHLDGALLHYSDLSNAEFIHTPLTDANLPYAKLESAMFEHCNLERSQFSNAKLNQAVFIFSKLSGAVLVQAELKGAGFVSTDLSEANLIQADLEGSNLSMALGLTLKQVKAARNYDKSALPQDIGLALQKENTDQSKKE